MKKLFTNNILKPQLKILSIASNLEENKNRYQNNKTFYKQIYKF